MQFTHLAIEPLVTLAIMLMIASFALNMKLDPGHSQEMWQAGLTSKITFMAFGWVLHLLRVPRWLVIFAGVTLVGTGIFILTAGTFLLTITEDPPGIALKSLVGSRK